MFEFHPGAFGPVIHALFDPERLMPLGPGSPNLAVRAKLAALTPETAFPSLSDRSMASGCISALWLYHDFLDESHTISQDIDTPTGSYWHGIMHRREPDGSNAKYWFRHVGQHPVFDLLTAEIGQRWDPFAFIDRCEACRGKGGEEEMTCRRIQLREWQVLFAWCFKQAANRLS